MTKEQREILQYMDLQNIGALPLSGKWIFPQQIRDSVKVAEKLHANLIGNMSVEDAVWVNSINRVSMSQWSEKDLHRFATLTEQECSCFECDLRRDTEKALQTANELRDLAKAGKAARSQ
jgi:hypothetical protein